MARAQVDFLLKIFHNQGIIDSENGLPSSWEYVNQGSSPTPTAFLMVVAERFMNNMNNHNKKLLKRDSYGNRPVVLLLWIHFLSREEARSRGNLSDFGIASAKGTLREFVNKALFFRVWPSRNLRTIRYSAQLGDFRLVFIVRTYLDTTGSFWE